MESSLTDRASFGPAWATRDSVFKKKNEGRGGKEERRIGSWVQKHMAAIPNFRRLQKKGYKFKSTLSCMVRSCLNK